ncbi:hypothetical protein AGMMS49579_16980 [Spirochaetia bacterium]|nr:hypothetical protein AGMMS49579_16980 [Spirochaetia bacterium]
MKTTKKMSKLLKLGVFALIAAFGMILAGCDDGSSGSSSGSSGGGGDSGETYINGTRDKKFVLSGSNFKFIERDDAERDDAWVITFKGTFTVSGTTATLTITHQWDGQSLRLDPGSGTATFSSDGRTITYLTGAYTRP